MNIGYFKDMTKEKAEIVITRFDEPLDWIRGIEHIATIYNKGAPYESEAITLQTPNYGCGLETMLRHIIKRYDSLAEVTFFSQGRFADRSDQPIYPLDYYFRAMTENDVRGVLTDSYDLPKSRYRTRLSSPDTYACGNKTLAEFRQTVVGIPYRYLVEYWVRGDWISVGRNVIRNKPKSYYCHLYAACKFGRGVLVEECWFLERSWYAIFKGQLKRGFTTNCSEDVILSE